MTRYLVVSDIHGNLEALEAVLGDAKPFDKVICLGDYVDYGANPNEVIELMKRQKSINLVGNHDLVQTGKLPLHHMHGEAMQCGRWTTKNLTPKNLDWLKMHKSEALKPEFSLVHGSPYDSALDYIDSVGKAIKIFENFPFKLLLHGHSHVPIVFVEGKGYCAGSELEGKSINVEEERSIINCGSVGQPRDGDERSSYGILENGFFIWKRVEYDIAAAQKKIIDAGLPNSQAERLLYGN